MVEALENGCLHLVVDVVVLTTTEVLCVITALGEGVLVTDIDVPQNVLTKLSVLHTEDLLCGKIIQTMYTVHVLTCVLTVQYQIPSLVVITNSIHPLWLLHCLPCSLMMNIQTHPKDYLLMRGWKESWG